MKRKTILLITIITSFVILTSCSMEYQISHPHVQHQKSKRDHWTHSQITMIEQANTIAPETASVSVAKEASE